MKYVNVVRNHTREFKFNALKIYTGKNYSMQDPSNVAMVIKMSNIIATSCFVYGMISDQEQRFREMGFEQSANMLAYIKSRYKNSPRDMHRLKEDLDIITMKFTDEK